MVRNLCFISSISAMPYLDTWEEFEKAAERLYLQDPMKVRTLL